MFLTMMTMKVLYGFVELWYWKRCMNHNDFSAGG